MSTPGSTGKQDKSVKDLFDRIGKDVYETVEKEAKERSNGDLKGFLTSTTILGERAAFLDPCEFKYDELLGANNERYPCKNLSGKYVERFSDTLGGQCTDSKMRSGGKGACAPYRRLHLCHHNLESINTDKIDSGNARHKLLAEVCMAAKYEGDSIKTPYTIHQLKYSDSNICTVLARSFADIGDIVRGRDLFLGNTYESAQRKQLDKKLKEVFGKIYEGLSKNGAQDHYKDENGGNFFKLREDWWTANRAKVWEAITCKADTGNAYFRPTCGDSTRPSVARNKCRCGNGDVSIVPTYFDYVPQYLRWFEEWSEDFCRKRKHRLKDVRKICRGEDGTGNERYCSGNGFDCKGTFRAKNKYRWDYKCAGCFLSCSHFRTWIAKQKDEFEKQKNKYQTEIQTYTNGTVGSGRGSRGKRRGASTTNYDGYEKKFYNKLKEKDKYVKVDDFLDLLSKETTCTKNSDIKEGGQINFKTVNSAKNSDGDGNNKTFSRTEICEPCPWCGVTWEKGKWERKDSKQDCPHINLYRPKNKDQGTPINFLYSGDEATEIGNNLKAFCDQINRGTTNSVARGGGADGSASNSKELYQYWKCYQFDQLVKDEGGMDDEDYNKEVKNGGGLCILEKNKNKKEEKTKKSEKDHDEMQKTFNNFFYYWVVHMLKDSIYWRTKKLSKCLQNGNTIKCGKNCKDDCGCFQKWVEKKKDEWKNIKIHFGNQEDFKNKGENGGSGMLGEEIRSPAFVLQEVLKKEVLLTSLQEAYRNEKDIKHIKDLLEDEVKGFAGVLKGKTIIDLLIDHEEDEAEQCKQKQNECEKKAKAPKPGDLARSATDTDDSPRDPPEEEEEEEDNLEEDTEEVKDGGGEAAEEKSGATEDQVDVEAAKETTGATDTTTPQIDVCDTVATALTGDNLTKACSTKYGSKAPTSWKCIPSGDEKATSDKGSDAKIRHRRDTTSGAVTATTSGAAGAPSDSNQGSICVPPRRRRLYIQKLHDWASDGNTQSVGGEAPPPQGDTTSPSEALLKAFIESAAIETFFLWDRYKKEWMAQKLAEKARQNGLGGAAGGLQPPDGSSGGEQNPEQQLLEGEIPEEFKRQMFYTLGDYRDILFSGDKDKKNGYSDIFSGDKEMKEKEEKIKDAIERVLKNGDSQTPSGKDPESWWEKHGKDIWEGMICALTYKDGGEGKTIEKVNAADGNLFQKLKENNDYKTVKLENSETEAKKATDPPTTLTDFISRPTYFRYLEEWGQNFCKERKKRLEEVKKACRENSSGDPKFCSGDGHDCTDPELRHKNMSADPDCPDCYEQCRKYRKWIDIKFAEFHEQKSKYEGELQKLNCNSSGDNNCCTEIKKHSTAASFLKELKHCKNSEDDTDKSEEDKKNKIDFDKPENTFNPSTYCKTCPIYGVKCNSGSRRDKSGKDPCTAVDAKGKSWDSVFNANGGKSSTIEVEMIDRRGSFIEKYIKNSKNSFKDSYLFKSVRNQNWTCKFNKDEKMDVCKLDNFDQEIDLNQYTTFKVFLEYWLEDFIESYYILKKRKLIEQCTKRGKNTCDEETKKNCVCVKTWVEQKKKEEWGKIQQRFNEQYKNGNEGDYPMRSFLETWIPKIPVANAKGNVTKLSQLDYSCGCSTSASSTNGKDEDAIECMINKLTEKIKTGSCLSQPSGEPDTPCQKSPPLVEDDDEPEQLEEQTENTVEHPKICGDVLATTKPTDQTDDKCDEKDEEEKEPEQKGNDIPPAEPAQDTESETKSKEEKPAQDEAKPPAPPRREPPVKPAPRPRPQRPRRPRRTPQIVDHPAVIPSLVTSTLAWSVGIGFAAFTYFFLKKKTKSTIDLLRVINIPKGDYDIPTKLSPNRYIPYTSGKYRGKRYIYLEGDSGTDSGYTDHYSDITSSSESEYEDLDINDIYVPGSPKYKTLIEVVLEPSGKLSGNTIPTSGNNTTASDTQNDIQNDGIPSSKITDNEWNTLKHEFISNMLQNTQNTEPNILRDNLDNNTNPKTLHVSMDEKPFITSIHDRNLYSGEEYNYNVNMVNKDNIPINRDNNVYSGIDLINDALSGNKHIDIYDELLKRKENELFGTNHVKQTSIHSVAKLTNSDPIHNQLELFHKWLDRHRDMCEKWENHHERLAKLKEQWENETHSGNTHPSDSNKTLNTDVSIQIHMDNPKPINQFTNMDTILEDLEKYNEPYYDVQDDIYYDVNDDNDISTVDSNNMDVPSKVQIEMDVNTKLVKEKYPIADNF
ncbi:erythrocyte membrane protein 1 [Plasmodium falciparum RAJ116]|uniref:Erythrocyte membrane protein 1 n=1 Tax=Plasmodium falciparum RAJ116 TaxID=580058 RepID=A0A0L0CUD0_PLAFA|nr:erythrocyte membrane protein 1 [Plasmodium falciparum RAJ116]